MRQIKIPQFEVAQYPKEQLEKVQSLFAKSFGGRILPLDYIKWQMELNPCMKRTATTLWKNSILVAYQALTPYYAIYKGQEIVAAVGGTKMVDEDYLGASIQLAAECARQNERVKIIIGFPNRNAFRIAVKYSKHHYIGDMAFWITNAAKQKVSDNICKIFSFSDEYEKISRTLSKTHVFINSRKGDYLNWRFFKKPGYSYNGFAYVKNDKLGYIVVDVYVENNIRQLQVVDIIAETKEIFKELLIYSINLAHEWKCSLVKLWLSSAHYTDVLTDLGFIYGEHPFRVTCWNQDLDINNSYITMADSDIF